MRDCISHAATTADSALGNECIAVFPAALTTRPPQAATTCANIETKPGSCAVADSSPGATSGSSMTSTKRTASFPGCSSICLKLIQHGRRYADDSHHTICALPDH